MPTYEYGCAACGSEWEEIQRITEPPHRGLPQVRQALRSPLISAGGGFILKGGGWYSDLYSSAKPASNKEESKSTTSSDASGKTESTAAKTERRPSEDRNEDRNEVDACPVGDPAAQLRGRPQLVSPLAPGRPEDEPPGSRSLVPRVSARRAKTASVSAPPRG